MPIDTITIYPMHEGSSMHEVASTSFFTAYNDGKTMESVLHISMILFSLTSKKSD